MKTQQRFKLSAGAGLVTMLLGALMVLAPSAGAEMVDGVWNLPAEGGRVPICHATRSHQNPYVLNMPSFSATGGPWANHDSHDGEVYDPAFADQKKAEWGDIIPPVAVDGHLVYPGSENWDDGGSELYETCSATTPSSPVVIIEKVVPGEPDDTTEFQFGVTQDEVAVAFVGQGDDLIAEGETLEAEVVAGEVVVTETATEGYSLSSVTCVRDYVDEDEEAVEGEAVTVDDDLVAGTATFNAADGDIITCTFTNDPDQGGGDTGSIRIDKVADGTAPQPANQAYGFTAACQNAAGGTIALDTSDASFNLTNSAAAKVIDELPAGATCTIEETVRHSPNRTTVKVGTAAAVEAIKAEDVTVVADQVADVVFTNTFNAQIIIIETPTTTTTTPPPPASLRIDKVVETVGGGDGPDTWEVQFDVVGEDVDASRTLDQNGSTARIGDLDAGTYTITELADEGSTLTDIECVERNGSDVVVEELTSGEGAAVTLDAGDNVVCTFTNSYPEVAPAEEEPEPEPKPAEEKPAPKPTPAVLGDVVTRPQTLPRTGDETKGLAGVGTLLVALGAAMVIGSKRQLAKR